MEMFSNLKIILQNWQDIFRGSNDRFLFSLSDRPDAANKNWHNLITQKGY
jgi:hypothetical protein